MLAVIRDYAAKTQKVIAAAMKITEPRVSALIQQARKAGLLHSVLLKLTKRGNCERHREHVVNLAL